MSRVGRVAAMLRQRVAALYRLDLLPRGALLPARLVYGFACLRGDVRYWRDAVGRERIKRNLAAVLGDVLTEREQAAAAREFFRTQYCALMDWLRLRGDGRALTQLVEARGLEHLHAALAEGRGALICTGHFGDYQAVFSVLGALGIPGTCIKREAERDAQQEETGWETRNDRLLYDALARHLSRPYINPLAGQFATAVQAAQVLRQNEALGVYIDPPALAADQARTSTFAFLGREVRLLTGSLTVAQKMKSPVFVALLHRGEDWRHQVLEIVPVGAPGGDVAETFGACLAVIEAAVRRRPGQWLYWDRTEDLLDLGLLAPDAVAAREGDAPVVTRSRLMRWLAVVGGAAALVALALLVASLPRRGLRSAGRDTTPPAT